MFKIGRFYADIMALNDEVTGSLYLVIIKFPNGKDLRFVVDCGLFQEEKYDDQNSILPFNAENIDFCLVTHVHVDHVGRLPYMVKKGFYKPIYTTETNCKLLPYALGDSYKVLKTVSKRKNVKSLYSDSDVDKTLSLMKPCKYNQSIQINDNIKVTFLNNGHLIGAASILVQISCYESEEDINLLFSGDYNNKNMFFDVNPIPNWIKKLPLTVIQESTYGDMDSNKIYECFESNIKECLKKNGTVLALVFSLGRSQEILYVLKKMQDAGELDINIPIYFDGKLAIKYTKLFIKDGLDINQDLKDFLPKNLKYVDKTNRYDVLKDTNVKIIVTTSGMGSYGPAQTYIPEYVTRKDALIHFTGYTAKGTLGRKLKDASIGEIVDIGGVLAKKGSNVAYTTEFSAHAKADEMIVFLKQFSDLKFVLVTHGEHSTKETFAKRVLKEVNVKNVSVLGRSYFLRINPYGLVKALPTKFE